MSKYIEFVEIESKTKTRKFSVINKSGEYLGAIKWATGWRRYVFITNECQYDISCLNDIINFIKEIKH